MPNIQNTISRELRALASPPTAAILQRFFKTGAGQYGEGDVFLGIKMPLLRALARQHRAAAPEVAAALLQSHYHEERMLALLLLMQFYERAGEAEQCAVFDLYLANTRRINNWDLVDVSAPHIAGHHLQIRPREVLYGLARSASLWGAMKFGLSATARCCTGWRVPLRCGSGASPSSPRCTLSATTISAIRCALPPFCCATSTI